MAKSKKTFFSNLLAVLLITLMNRHFLAFVGLVICCAAFLFSANAMVENDELYTVGREADGTSILYTFAGSGHHFTIKSNKLDSFRPAFMPREDFNELLLSAHRAGKISIWDDGLFGKITEVIMASEASRWLRAKPVLARWFPNRVVVKFYISRPFASVKYLGGTYYVDDRAMRLPVSGSDIPGLDVPLIKGVLAQPPYVGEKWPGYCVRDSVALSRFLERELVTSDGKKIELVKDIQRVECNSAPAKKPNELKPRLTLIHSSGCEIFWDSFFTASVPTGKPGKVTKLKNLITMLVNGKVKDLSEVKRIDLSLKDPSVIYNGRR
ncbi:MAG: hypothetical protein U5N86_01605 [Planctomycetota bacterium]|nr:hypothetical protein [Planctomycetota bacterium]